MPKKIFLVLFAALVAFVLLAGCGATKTAGEKTGKTVRDAAKTSEKTGGAQLGPPAPGPKPGEKAPAFKLPELNSQKEVAFPEDFQGKRTALLFFSAG
ncbi:MAG: hypothetical protein AB1652_00455 [Bacillota bacterium]